MNTVTASQVVSTHTHTDYGDSNGKTFLRLTALLVHQTTILSCFPFNGVLPHAEFVFFSYQSCEKSVIKQVMEILFVQEEYVTHEVVMGSLFCLAPATHTQRGHNLLLSIVET